ELANMGALKKLKVEKTKYKPSQPIAYEVDEFVILVGKNNIQNDKLTFKVANGGDLWIHTQKAHGSHVIVFAEGREIPDKVIQIACEIAVYYSLGNNATKQECDYTFRRNLKRHPSGKLGMVFYTTYKTAYVSPDRHDEYLAK
ncbi:MAG: NFACT RNA binding domain-containing protein, partial [Clostridia bacterium]|nr:NFACT RNA binding domain-containing protein [Clostridia bacterium]